MIDFERSNFFPIKKKLSSFDILDILNKSLIQKNIKDNFIIEDISTPKNLKNNSIIFFSTNQKIQFENTKKILFILDNEKLIQTYENYIIVNNLNNSYNLILNSIYTHDDSKDYSDEFDYIDGSYISKYCHIDKNAKIGKNCLIGRGVKIGKNSIIKNNVVIKNAIINESVIICDNSTIGTTGFGFNLSNPGSQHINPQLGIVYIDDFVHIGSNCTVDRAKIDVTYIGKNSMIDNLVHVAHNVIIGNNVTIAAQTGISGSTKIGNNVVIGGQVGFAGHIVIEDNVLIAAKSGVTKNIKKGSTIAGFPAIDIKEWKKRIINEKKNSKLK